MINGLSIWSDGGCVSNLAGGDLTVSRGGQTLSESVGRWLVVGRGCPVRGWGPMIGRWGTVRHLGFVSDGGGSG